MNLFQQAHWVLVVVNDERGHPCYFVPQMPKPKHTDILGKVNQKIVAEGETLPVVRLKDGSPVQTGTVATMLFNIRQFDQGARGEIEKELELAVPTLFKVGLFDLFTPEEWIAGSSPGRKFVGQKAIDFRKSQKL